MRSLNRVFIMGHVGHDPELIISKSGKPYSRLNVATKETWMNAEDQRQERTDWHSVFVWGALAQQCVNHLRKGALVFVEGSLTYWKVAQDTNTQYKNAIHGREVKFLNIATGKSENLGTDIEDLDNMAPPRNHNAVAHPA